MKANTLVSLHSEPSTIFTLVCAMLVMLTGVCGNASAVTEKPLHVFDPYPRGAYPDSNLISDASGNLYGTSSGGGLHDLGIVFELAPNSKGGWTESVLYGFKGGSDGAGPHGLVMDATGNIYGTTGYGGDGSVGYGVVFELSPTSHGGWAKTVIHRFTGGDGAGPNGLVLDATGNIYGTTSGGGNLSCGNGHGCGVTFELSPKPRGGWKESVLYAFGSYSGDAEYPTGSPVRDEAGNLYGASSGGADACGAVFELSPSGGRWTETVAYSFTGSGGDGCFPAAGMLLDAAGNLYGGAGGGAYGNGVVFELSPSSGGWVEDLLYAFAGGSDGSGPIGSLAFDKAGRLYGVTEGGGGDCGGGSGNCGTVFELAPGSGSNWTESLIHRFSNGADGFQPLAGPLLDSSGNVYVTAQFGGRAQVGAASKLTPGSGGSWMTSVLFGFPSTDGGDSSSTLIFDPAGNLYGTAYYGGSHGFGTVYKVSPRSGGGWTESVLYSFKGGKDGAYPLAGVVLDTAGNLYGTAGNIVFKLSPNQKGGWTETVLHSFKGGSKGADPNGLVLDAAGNIYGTASGGGKSGGNCFSSGCGVVFKLSPNTRGIWTETVLWTFSGYPYDGSLSWSNFLFGPGAALVLDAAGGLYGTTPSGGRSTSCDNSGCGTVFKLTPPKAGDSAWTEHILHSFATATGDGISPLGTLVFDQVGHLYGTTEFGGTGACTYQAGCGTVFQLSPSSRGEWNEKVLYNFCSKTNCDDGLTPASNLIFDQNGNLYGTTPQGNSSGGNWGLVFKLSPGSGGNWTESTVFAFDGGKDGGSPYGGLVSGSTGNFYGATQGGGDNPYLGYGVVYMLTP
jgi:uncharacterized repeat protein (TIGR03803 family)